MSKISRINSFKTVVDYVQPPFPVLDQKFRRVAKGYGLKRFVPIEECKGVVTKARSVSFVCLRMVGKVGYRAVLAEMERRGLRPALYEELLAFSDAHPNEAVKSDIVALGSLLDVEYDGDHDDCVAVLKGGERGLELELDFTWDDWHEGYCFLAARKNNEDRKVA